MAAVTEFRLYIVSPEKTIFSGDADMAVFPGEKGRFTVLCNHAPLISVLEKGVVRWRHGGSEQMLEVSGGFVEVKKNMVTACVEVV